MEKNILVTGGAGFIGSHLVDRLIVEGHNVTILDLLDPQVHPNSKKPPFLNKKARFVKGNVLETKLLLKLLKDAEIVFHQAAVVGVGQSMYKLNYYVENNIGGTANLLEALINKENSVKKLIIASSMSSYGEGEYECANCGRVFPKLREIKQLKEKKWEVKCPNCNLELKPIPTTEEKLLDSNSIYAISKKTQEEMTLNIGKTYSIPTVALRYFNVYGTRQSLNNPYTGVMAIFLNLIKNNKSPVVFEDGLQTRDFVSVYDIVQANILAMKSKNADYESFNVGTGKPTSIKELSELLIKFTGSKVFTNITYKFRKGDIRHCIADISKIKLRLGFKPEHSIEKNIQEILNWSKTVKVTDNFKNAEKELIEHDLI
ncbi:MAG: NAD-dependent epimerase/dehydratase family protein [Candidatus Diapherotrites archaeon]|nr:NAD-dependent epimerase/dehydratase family protein [Candidatus Diapherotrites archaeon]